MTQGVHPLHSFFSFFFIEVSPGALVLYYTFDSTLQISSYFVFNSHSDVFIDVMNYFFMIFT